MDTINCEACVAKNRAGRSTCWACGEDLPSLSSLPEYGSVADDVDPPSMSISASFPEDEDVEIEGAEVDEVTIEFERAGGWSKVDDIDWDPIDWDEYDLDEETHRPRELLHEDSLEEASQPIYQHTFNPRIEKPSYYQFSEDCSEVLDVIVDKDLGFCLGNVLKYVLRAGDKPETDAVEDLRKAKVYLERAIEERIDDDG